MAQEELKIVIEADDQATKVIQGTTKSLQGLDKASIVAAKGIGQVNKAVANANPTLVNFGRVLQDAPFGIIGIANNIDPLISSFQSLQKQTGSSSSAFKALGASLLGPAGIAVGVSAATSALIAFGPQISRAISGVNRFEQAQIDAAGKSAEAFVEAQNKFNDYLRVINDGTSSLARQNNALEGANRLLAEYGLKIDNVATLQRSGAQIGAIFAQIKQEEAKAQFLAAKAAEEYSRFLILQAKAEQGDFLGAFGDLRLIDQIRVAFGGVAGVGQAVAGTVNQIADNQKTFQDASNASKQTIDQLIQSIKSINGVKEDFGKATRKATEDSKQENIVLTEIQKRQALNLTVLKQTKAEIDAQTEAQKKLNEQKRIEQALSPLGAGLGPAAFSAVDTSGLSEQLRINQEINAEEKKRADNIANTQSAFELLTPVIDQTFAALANGQNAFDAIIQGLKRLIVELIKAVAQAFILSAILNAIAPGSGSFKSIFRGLLGFGGRANGGFVGAGTPYVVGEAGPELFVPQTNGSIVPNMQMGGGGTLTARVAGNDLLFILNQAQGNKRRNFA